MANRATETTAFSAVFSQVSAMSETRRPESMESGEATSSVTFRTLLFRIRPGRHDSRAADEPLDHTYRRARLCRECLERDSRRTAATRLTPPSPRYKPLGSPSP